MYEWDSQLSAGLQEQNWAGLRETLLGCASEGPPGAQGTLLLKARRGGKPSLSPKHHSSLPFVYPAF